MPPSPRIDRRTAVGIALAGAATLHVPAFAQRLGARRAPRALAFDGFTIFDPRAVTAAIVALAPSSGVALAGAFTNKLFALSWLETAAGRYSGFEALADASLRFTAEAMSVELGAAQRREVIGVFSELPVWPDALAALEKMRAAGIRLAFLSNLSAGMLTSSMRRGGIDKLMEPPISTDRVRAFKPAQRAYAMGPEVFGIPAADIGFAAFGGWDALGAKWFGYRTAWINRLGVTGETLDPVPDASARDLSAALALAGLGV